MSVGTVAMLILVATFGLTNVVDNLVSMGLSAIPSWFVVGMLYFLPLSLILAEFASDTKASGGIYSYMERGIGPFWAFVGTWSYFVANIVYLQMSFSKLPTRLSLSLTGVDAFASNATLIPLLAVAICVLLTYIATRGVQIFSRLANWVGKATLVMAASLIVVPLMMVIFGGAKSANTFSIEEMKPTFDLTYFATFSWLLFAVSGSEVAAPYVNQVKNPARDFPRAILFSTFLICAIYVLASIAVVFVFPLDQLTKTTGLFDIWLGWSEQIGLPGITVAKVFMTIINISLIAAIIIWAESPIRAMFAEVPKGTFPAVFTRRDATGTHRKALWIQALVVVVLILIPLASNLTGSNTSEHLFGLLNDMSSLSLVVPFVFIALAYIQARRKGMDAPFKMVRSTPLAVGIGVAVVVVSALGYFGAGLFALDAETIDWVYVVTIYGGPLLLIGLGIALRYASLASYHKNSGHNELT
jgi:amino acid transporter